MRSKRFILLMAMLVLAIFAVGSVSAADNVTADIDVPTEDIAIDDVPVEDVVESEDLSVDESNKVFNTRLDRTILINSTEDDIQGKIDEVHYAGGGNIYFETWNYTDINLTLYDNIKLFGNGSKLTGDGVNYVFTVDNCKNIEISGFIIDVGYNGVNHTAAIRGSHVLNVNIHDNTMCNGYDGINLNKNCSNIQITDNNIYNMVNDGVSIANPVTFTTISSVGYSSISRNNISNCGYGIFIGGNFNGEIKDNKISNCDNGIEFAGKPKPAAGNGTLSATLYNNTISSCDYGINMFHPNVQYLYLDLMVFDNIEEYDIYTKSPFGTYSYIGVYNSIFDIGVTQAFYNAVGSNKGNNTNFTYY